MLHDTRIKNQKSTFEILLVEDNLGDSRLISEAIKLASSHIRLNTVVDGIQAMAYLLKHPPYSSANIPDLIFLDLNIPKKNGISVLNEIKNNPNLKRIPVIVLTISSSEDDILQCYNAYANCYIVKPFEIESFIQIFKVIESFWFNVVTLPPQKERE